MNNITINVLLRLPVSTSTSNILCIPKKLFFIFVLWFCMLQTQTSNAQEITVFDVQNLKINKVIFDGVIFFKKIVSHFTKNLDNSKRQFTSTNTKKTTFYYISSGRLTFDVNMVPKPYINTSISLVYNDNGLENIINKTRKQPKFDKTQG